MAERSGEAAEPITGKASLVEYMEKGCKPRERWRIGTEHEKFAYRLEDLRPLPYEGARGIRALLEGLTRFGWEPVVEQGLPIALSKPDGGAITLEPAGQLELSGAPVMTVHQTCDEVGEHLQQVKVIAREMDIGFLGLGHHPKWPRSEMPWMPKDRYAIMRAYMPKKGSLGLEMMQSTCTVQVNLDFDSESTMTRMFRIGLALQPVVTALWANSPFKDGRPNGFLSYRSHVWTDTDPDRCGMLSFVFDEGFGFERYVDYMLDVPMYLVHRGDDYVDVAGQSFRDFLDGRLPGLPGESPTLGDWEDHLTTAFPEVRLKLFLEMRGADGGPWARLCALPAFWVGVLYDDGARDEAWELVRDWTDDERSYLRNEVPRQALHTPFRNRTVREVALDALEISHRGLRRRGITDSVGVDETHFLRPLFQIAETGLTPAEELLKAYEKRWQGNVDPVFGEYSY